MRSELDGILNEIEGLHNEDHCITSRVIDLEKTVAALTAKLENMPAPAVPDDSGKIDGNVIIAMIKKLEQRVEINLKTNMEEHNSYDKFIKDLTIRVEVLENRRPETPKVV